MPAADTKIELLENPWGEDGRFSVILEKNCPEWREQPFQTVQAGFFWRAEPASWAPGLKQLSDFSSDVNRRISCRFAWTVHIRAEWGRGVWALKLAAVKQKLVSSLRLSRSGVLKDVCSCVRPLYHRRSSPERHESTANRCTAHAFVCLTETNGVGMILRRRSFGGHAELVFSFIGSVP